MLCAVEHGVSKACEHHFALCMHGLRTAGRAKHLYGTLHAAAIHVGMSPDCRKLGLGVWKISIAAGTGADVMASGAGAAGRPLALLS